MNEGKLAQAKLAISRAVLQALAEAELNEEHSIRVGLLRENGDQWGTCRVSIELISHEDPGTEEFRLDFSLLGEELPPRRCPHCGEKL